MGPSPVNGKVTHSTQCECPHDKNNSNNEPYNQNPRRIPTTILHAHTHSTLSASSIALHLLANLDVDIEELAHAAVEADGFAFVQVTFAVVVGEAFLGAGFGQAVVFASQSLPFLSFCTAFFRFFCFPNSPISYSL